MEKFITLKQRECPIVLKKQLVPLLRQEWPQAFTEPIGEEKWPEDLTSDNISLLLVKNDILIAYLTLVQKEFTHKNRSYDAIGLSEVVTHPSYRRKGYGLLLLRKAQSIIDNLQVDISIFTCDTPLSTYYSKGGWEQIEGTTLVGGTKEKPFRSDLFDKVTMIRFLSKKAKIHRESFVHTDIFIELGENKLW